MKTSSFVFRGPGGISIARRTPEWAADGTGVYPALAPGRWFTSVPRDVYEQLYGEQLARLDPARVVADLAAIAGPGVEPTLLCWESRADCLSGRRWCHRHLASQWLRDTLGLQVDEFDPGASPQKPLF